MYTQSSVISFYPYGIVHIEHKNRHANHVLYLVYCMSNTLLIAYKDISTHAHLRTWRMLWGQFEEL